MLNYIVKGLAKIFGTKSNRDIETLSPRVPEINQYFESYAVLSNDQLRGKTTEFRERIATYLSEIDLRIAEQNELAEKEEGLDEKEVLYAEVDKLKKQRDAATEEILDEILPEAFAVVKEAARRFRENETLRLTATQLDRDQAVSSSYVTIDGEEAVYKNSWTAAGGEVKWDMLHYDVQLIGGMVLHKGKIAEMGTGEGKTLVATLPSYLNALPQLGVHIVTVNDYLARRDSEWMAPLFNFLGITVDCIDKHEPHSEGRWKAYRADITYGTNNEFGFDYLRDNMVRTAEEQVQRKHHYAMVDEVDSVLIDDARTPLIISGPVPRGDDQEFYALKPRIHKLVEAQKQLCNKYLQEAKRLISEGKTGVKEGEGGIALLRAHHGLPKTKSLIKFLSEHGVKQILLKTENHYMQDQSKEMPLVDQELYFTIDEKTNQVDLTDKGIELITGEGEDKDFFLLPDVGSAVAEIDNNEDLSPQEKLQAKDNLLRDFAVKSERVHTVQQLLKAYTVFERDVEYVVMDGKVKIVDEQTGRIMEGRRYSDGLHQAIEAKENVKVEAATQTFATITLQNFFRMYHKLAGMTGTAETEAGEFWQIYKLDCVVVPTNRPIARIDMDDKIYKTKREKYNSLIEEIAALREAGRPVLAGTTNVEDSELLSRMLNLRKVPHNVLNAKQHQREAEIVANAGQKGAVTISTNMAGRGTDIKLGAGVREVGGLAIIGTERHDSRRVDRQLRGRAGRQGDPGSSQFYVSLEDDLMRLFGTDRLAKAMDTLGYKEGEVIQHSMMSKSIERAQKKVEENNFGIRKRLLEYDDVMNAQREVIYKKRQNSLKGERVDFDLINMMYDLCDEVVQVNKEEEDFENFKLDVIRTFSVDTAVAEEAFKDLKQAELSNKLFDEVHAAYRRKSDHIAKQAYPVIKDVFESRGADFKNIVVPFTDGSHTLNVTIPLEAAYQSEGKEVVKGFEKSVILAFIDQNWKEHLRAMDDLKQSVQLAVHEQKDPLLIYKLESYNLFKSLISEINKEVVSFLMKGALPVQDPAEIRQARDRRTQPAERVQESRGQDSVNHSREGQPERPKVQPVRTEQKIGRNDPCPCGSGKKFKHCHGAMIES
jgi:preprotein translocase subunit SecA